VLFEAGALSKKVRESRVCTYLLDLTEGDISGPLGKFQHTRADKDDTRALLETLNNMMGDGRLDNDRFRQTYEQWWPDLANRIEAARNLEPSQKQDGRTMEEKVDDVLLELRALQRTIQSAARQQQLMDVGLSLTGRGVSPRRASLYEYVADTPASLQIELPVPSIDVRRFSCRTHRVPPLILEVGQQNITLQVCCEDFGDELRAIGAAERRGE
jgi:hypothetical protein